MANINIDYTTTNLFRDLLSTASQIVNKDLDRKAKLKANAMIMAKGEYDASLRELNNLSDEFRKVQTSYGILFDKVPEIESTDSSKIVKNNLLQWYTDSAVQINNKIQGLRSQLGTMYEDIGDITRVKAGLSKSISPAMGDPKIYDEADFQAERVAKIFGVSKEKVESFYAKQPETVPTAISALNKLAMEAKVEDLKKKGVSDKEARKQAVDIVSARVSKSKYIKRVVDVTSDEDLSPSKQREGVRNIGEQYGLAARHIIASEFEPLPSDDKKTREAKEARQAQELSHLFQTLSSFGKESYHAKDIVALGRFVNKLESEMMKPAIDIDAQGKEKPREKTPAEIDWFKKYVNRLFNIDLNAAGTFMLPGATLIKGEKKDVDVDIRDYESIPAFDMIATSVRLSGLKKWEYYAANRKEIYKVYQSKNPGKNHNELLNEIDKDFSKI